MVLGWRLESAASELGKGRWLSVPRVHSTEACGVRPPGCSLAKLGLDDKATVGFSVGDDNCFPLSLKWGNVEVRTSGRLAHTCSWPLVP